MALRTFPASSDVPSCVLIDHRVSRAICVDAATAYSQTSEKEAIEVSFSTARPPALSCFTFYIYGRQRSTDFLMEPRVISADGDLVVIRVPQNQFARVSRRFNDYFVYRIHAQRPELYLLPNPGRDALVDKDVAILNCGHGDYIVASLRSISYLEPIFRLQLCRSRDGGKPGHWTSRELSVDKPLRDSLHPMPDSTDMLAYHVTTKVITLGGDQGTVGWVDLWRGIILCDVLSMNPELRDMPLPLPSRGCQISFRNADPCIFRDIAVNHRKTTLKYIEMEICPKEVPAITSRSHPPLVVVGPWKATTYKMPIPVTSWNNWQPVGFISLQDLNHSFRMRRKLLHELMSSKKQEARSSGNKKQEARSSGNKKQEATEANLSLRNVQMAYPTLSVGDDNTVYMLCRGTSMVSKSLVVSVDVDVHAMNGVAKIDTDTSSSFSRHAILPVGCMNI